MTLEYPMATELWIEAVRERRKDLYSSAGEAARIAGFSRSTMAAIESGSHNPENLVRTGSLMLFRQRLDPFYVVRIVLACTGRGLNRV